VHPVDDSVNARLRGNQDRATAAFAFGKYIGQTPVQMGAALATFAVGRIRNEDKVSHFGMDLLRAHIVTGIITTGLKYATQRERPDDSNPHSFPSGHASITFATATVIERHLGWRMSALGYSIASYVAASRLHDNRHWLSDVVFGAAVGAIGGRTVTQHGRNTWTFVPTAVPGGVAFIVARRYDP
jgi:membrane-associated phospholipid phosphatase